MDLAQWEFYVLPVSKVREHGWRSISLQQLRTEQRSICPHERLTASLFPEVARQLIAEVAGELKSA
jgi:hypothetical protein